MNYGQIKWKLLNETLYIYYTNTGGKQLDDEDRRAAGLLNLINILPKLNNPPKYIFLENVVNFEV